jgi:hypothetical protein
MNTQTVITQCLHLSVFGNISISISQLPPAPPPLTPHKPPTSDIRLLTAISCSPESNQCSTNPCLKSENISNPKANKHVPQTSITHPSLRRNQSPSPRGGGIFRQPQRPSLADDLRITQHQNHSRTSNLTDTRFPNRLAHATYKSGRSPPTSAPNSQPAHPLVAAKQRTCCRVCKVQWAQLRQSRGVGGGAEFGGEKRLADASLV